MGGGVILRGPRLLGRVGTSSSDAMISPESSSLVIKASQLLCLRKDFRTRLSFWGWGNTEMSMKPKKSDTVVMTAEIVSE